MSIQRSDFASFFASVRSGQHPFAWQERLLDALLDFGRWPDRVVAPTGAGKTAVIDVHVFASALAAGGQAPRLPRRLVLVVDRRVVVDSHDEHARTVAGLLAEAPDGLLAAMAALLRSQRLDVDAVIGRSLTAAPAAEPLVTARLRGGAPPPRGWRDAPEACAVLAGTPDMIGSRVLLQGYGSSPRAWPREAGLLAFDTALVVDEAHLSRQFLRTARRVSALAASALTDGVPTLQVVETTATPAAGDGTEVGVQESDLGAPVLDARMRSPKPVRLLPVRGWPLKGTALDAVAAQVEQARGEFGPTVGCVVNRVATAVQLAGLLRARGLTVEVLVGRMRPADVSHLRRRRPGLLDIVGNRDVDVLVATQTVEVGLDLDLSALVTELAPGAALAQRSGRVNRLGRRTSTQVVVAVPEQGTVADKDAAPYSAADLSDSLVWLHRRVEDENGLAPWSLRNDAAPGQALRRRLLRRLELSDSWSWAASGDEPFARPDLDLWLADDLSEDRDIGMVSRRDLPSDPVQAVELLNLLPPRAHEVFPVPISTARGLVPHLLGGIPVLRWRRDDIVALVDSDDGRSLRVGDVLVVDDSACIHRGGVVEDSLERSPADDVLEAVQAGPAGVVRAGDAVWRWGSADPQALAAQRLPDRVVGVLSEGPLGRLGGWSRQQRNLLGDLLVEAALPSAESEEMRADLLRMRDAVVSLLRSGGVKESAVHVLDDADGRPAVLVVADLRRSSADEDIRQTWTPSETAVPLRQHADSVGRAAAAAGLALGLSPDVVELLRLAGLHHDDGKADDRFQLVLGRRPDDPPLAKGAARPASSDEAARSASGLPLGWRHEQRSVLDACRAVPEQHRRMVARLVGTTHGHGRSSFPHGARTLLGLGDGDELPADARALFDDGGWEQLVQDTDEQHGVWALAYLEAVLRAADGRVSAAGS